MLLIFFPIFLFPWMTSKIVNISEKKKLVIFPFETILCDNMRCGLLFLPNENWVFMDVFRRTLSFVWE